MKNTRRHFLCGAGASSLTLLLDHPAAEATSTEGMPYATLLELDKCIGCGACVDACRERNAARYPKVTHPMPELFPSGTRTEDWSDKQHVTDRLTPYNWLYIQTVQTQYSGKTQELHIPRRCMHCINAPCANLCPWGTASRDPRTGTVDIDCDVCLGGAKCQTVCPWHIPQRQSGVGLYLDLMPSFAGNGVMYKCDRCADSYSKGVLPACVEACPESVQSIGPRQEILAKAQKLAEEKGYFLYGVTDNGGTGTFYLSPVPFEELSKAAIVEPGRPTLAPVPHSLDMAASLGRKLLAAPVVGLAAGMLSTLPKQTTGAQPAAHWLKIYWVICSLLAGFTGLMQMPIASRYGLTRIPGMGWTGDFFITLHLHYLTAALIIGLGAFLTTQSLRGQLPPVSWWGKVRGWLVGGLVATGLVRVLKNMPSITFDPLFTQINALAHLALAATLGGLCLVLWLRNKGAWAKANTSTGK